MPLSGKPERANMARFGKRVPVKSSMERPVLSFARRRSWFPTLATERSRKGGAREVGGWFGCGLEMEGEFCGQGAGRNIVRPAERRQEVIQRILVGHVYGCEVEVHLITVGVEQVVLAHGHVEQVAGSNARGVAIIVAGARCGNTQERGAEL